MTTFSVNMFNNPEFDTLIMSNGVVRGGASLIAGRNAGTILRASFRRHFLLDSESILNLLSVYCESTPRLRRLKNAYKGIWDKHLWSDSRTENPCVGGSGPFYEFPRADRISFCFLEAGSLGSYQHQLGLSKFVPALCQCRSQNSSGTSSRPV